MFLGISGSVVALNRATGGQARTNRLKGAGLVSVLVETETVLAAGEGGIYCPSACKIEPA